MHGRGYVNEGDKIAANYIENEFKKIGLKPFREGFIQEFNFPVNTFPGQISVTIDGTKLVPGKDFIIYSRSPKSKGSFKIVLADEKLITKKKCLKKFQKQNFSNKVILVNDTGNQTKELQELTANQYKAKGIISLKDKLTWSISRDTLPYPIIEILRTSINKAKKIELDIETKFISAYTSQNIIGYIEGALHPDSFFVFSAHYDHLGRMGKDTYFPGANDNASGIAVLLNLAKYYSKPENKPKYSIAFMAFGAEEAGLLGSKFYTENPFFSLSKIKFLANMDIMGTGDEGITAVNATEHKKEFDLLVDLNNKNNYLKQVKPRGKTANSDHYHFSEKGVKAFFIYTMGGIKAYHDIYDKAETLPLTKFEEVFKLLAGFISALSLSN